MKVSGDTIVPENFDDCVALILNDSEYPPLVEAERELSHTHESWRMPNRESVRDMAFAFALRERPRA